MLLRLGLILLFIYLIIKLIQGPKRNRRSAPGMRFYFNRFRHGGMAGNRNKSRKTDFDRIEEAEFEDITDKEKERKTDKP